MSVLVTPPLASAATLHRLRSHAAFFPDVHIFTLLARLCQLNHERSREERDVTYKLDAFCPRVNKKAVKMSENGGKNHVMPST